MPTNDVICARCGRPAAPRETGPVPFLFRLGAAFSLAAIHAGVWLWHDLSLPYCPRCRRWLAFLCVVLAVFAATAGFFGLRWILSLKP